MIFEEVSAATAAVYAEDGFVFFGRPLKVAYAREKSDRVAKQDGSFSKEVKEKRGRKRAAAEAATGGGESLAGVAQKHVKIEGGDGIIGAGGAVAVEGQQTVPDGPPSGGGAIPPPPPPPRRRRLRPPQWRRHWHLPPSSSSPRTCQRNATR